MSFTFGVSVDFSILGQPGSPNVSTQQRKFHEIPLDIGLNALAHGLRKECSTIERRRQFF